MSNRLKIGVSQGDTNGVGWEIILKIFSDSRMTELCTPVIYGSSAAAEYYEKCLEECDRVKFNVIADASVAQQGRVNLVECGDKRLNITPGKPSKAGGEAAAAALSKAIEELKAGDSEQLLDDEASQEAAPVVEQEQPKKRDKVVEKIEESAEPVEEQPKKRTVRRKKTADDDNKELFPFYEQSLF